MPRGKKGDQIVTVELKDLVLDSANARLHGERNISEIARSLQEFGLHAPLVVQRGTNRILVGNGRYEAMLRLGWTEAPVLYVEDDNITAVRRALADNRTAELAEWDNDVLAGLLAEVGNDLPGWTDEELEALLSGINVEELSAGSENDNEEHRSLSERFGIPPFSVLNTREGIWQGRKKAWLALGMQSEIGRGASYDAKHSGGLLFKSVQMIPGYYDAKAKKERELGRSLNNGEFIEKYYKPDTSGTNSGTSIFDPVLCELVYRWFSREGDTILDPFAGGSVRGIVASRLGRRYFGLDLRAEQVESNRRQLGLCGDAAPEWIAGDSARIGELAAGFCADLILSCPPYADLEVYSDNPDDLSTMSYSKFMEKYRHIIAETCALLQDDRFACFVVSEVRDRKGDYYCFVSDTVRAFIDAGLSFYNDAVLVNAVVTGAIRAARPFEGSRKLCKVHQNVLIFVKGDAKKATERLGSCEFGEMEELYEG